MSIAASNSIDKLPKYVVDRVKAGTYNTALRSFSKGVS